MNVGRLVGWPEWLDEVSEAFIGRYLPKPSFRRFAWLQEGINTKTWWRSQGQSVLRQIRHCVRWSDGKPRKTLYKTRVKSRT